jgi:Ca2+-binding EF-hand superfamily protein
MISKLKLTVASAVLAVGGLSGFALAKGQMGPRKAMVEKFDANKDGKLDDAEKAKLASAKQAMFAQKKAEKLAKFDANKDGSLDDAERLAMHDERVAKRFAMLDANKDGAITLDEMKAAKHGNGHRRGGHHRGGFRGGMTK